MQALLQAVVAFLFLVQAGNYPQNLKDAAINIANQATAASQTVGDVSDPTDTESTTTISEDSNIAHIDSSFPYTIDNTNRTPVTLTGEGFASTSVIEITASNSFNCGSVRGNQTSNDIKAKSPNSASSNCIIIPTSISEDGTYLTFNIDPKTPPNEGTYYQFDVENYIPNTYTSGGVYDDSSRSNLFTIQAHLPPNPNTQGE